MANLIPRVEFAVQALFRDFYTYVRFFLLDDLVDEEPLAVIIEHRCRPQRHAHGHGHSLFNKHH